MNILRIAAVVMAVPLLILGGHGLYAHFYKVEIIIGDSDPSKLFFSVPMTAGISDAVYWMSEKGVQSWFLPTVLVLLGILFLAYAFKRETI